MHILITLMMHILKKEKKHFNQNFRFETVMNIRSNTFDLVGRFIFIVFSLWGDKDEINVMFVFWELDCHEHGKQVYEQTLTLWDRKITFDSIDPHLTKA